MNEFKSAKWIVKFFVSFASVAAVAKKNRKKNYVDLCLAKNLMKRRILGPMLLNFLRT